GKEQWMWGPTSATLISARVPSRVMGRFFFISILQGVSLEDSSASSAVMFSSQQRGSPSDMRIDAFDFGPHRTAAGSAPREYSRRTLLHRRRRTRIPTIATRGDPRALNLLSDCWLKLTSRRRS